MYHTFQVGDAAVGARDFHNRQRPQPARRVSTSHACLECRRRKIRCDGSQPCQQCVWYHHPELCSYIRPTRKTVPSRKVVEELQTRVQTLTGLCTKLFPGHDPQTLATMSRGDLLRLLQTIEDVSGSPASTGQHTTSAAAALMAPANSDRVTAVAGASGSNSRTATLSSPGQESLSALERAPERDPAADEAQRYGQQIQAISDDVNALSITVRRQSSYLGTSSASAALEVIFLVEPSARTYMAQNQTATTNPSRRNSQSGLELDFSLDPTTLPSPDVGHKYIEAYFTYVHPLMPMIDEQEFRHLYLYTNRNDAPWLALLNVVLALGALADRTSGHEDHLIFSYRARSLFTLEMFGSCNLFLLQALGLLTGYYLHWVSRPNEANALMGAALRMAAAMGLHREFTVSAKGQAAEIPAETRRRTWWTLVILDTYAAMTTGRPSLGRLGPGITVEGPKIPEQTNNAQYLASIKLLPIVHNVKFSRLATNIQDLLARQPILSASLLNSLDAELVQWHEELPPIIRDCMPPDPSEAEIDEAQRRSSEATIRQANHSSPSKTKAADCAAKPPHRPYVDCPEQLKTPRLVMYWWYMTLRILAHRPLLLASALRRLPFTSLSKEEQAIISKCRQLAGQMITDISRTEPVELMACWNAVWMIYHATMVPLVSLFMHTSLQHTSGASADTDDEVMAWKWQINTSIQFLESMEEIIPTSWKSKMMLRRLYDANQHIAAQTPATQALSPPPGALNSEMAPQSIPTPAAPGENLTLAADVNLDDWLQTYNEHTDPMDTSTAWDGLLWDYTTMNSDANATPYAYSGNFTFGRPPIYRDNSGSNR